MKTANPLKRGIDIGAVVDAPPPLDPPPEAKLVQVLPEPAIDGAIDEELADLPADPPPAIPASPHPRKAKGRSRSGSRLHPYPKADGSGHTIKQSFHASLEFDDLWRELPGLLPRGTQRCTYVEKVLTKHVLALKRAKAQRAGS